ATTSCTCCGSASSGARRTSTSPRTASTGTSGSTPRSARRACTGFRPSSSGSSGWQELGPMMRAAPTEEMRIFLCTQIADEARHVAFFDRFYSEVGVLESDNLEDRLKETSAHLNENFGVLFDDMLKRRVD